MPSRETVQQFIDTVVSGRHDEAIKRFYTEDATMQENFGETRRGRDLLIAHERGVMGAFADGRIESEKVGPALIEGDHVAINWIFKFFDAEGRLALEMNEVALQKWRGEKIAAERFYYDPGQRAAKTG
ncbi:nuclear transport factor 2 family protein [Parvibaculum sp.]|uniref:nuclear transport factor 2 family protein n=1 Tax=Parvibaculum sp. TaxID=2024848 RepID=UPI002D09C860|nr:nuclear transport factor 2 family protein [Parvibaculum sp.]HUD50030.1 nuclear transport factor 2 family protein [Parvibaculum sp.]